MSLDEYLKLVEKATPEEILEKKATKSNFVTFLDTAPSNLLRFFLQQLQYKRGSTPTQIMGEKDDGTVARIWHLSSSEDLVDVQIANYISGGRARFRGTYRIELSFYINTDDIKEAIIAIRDVQLAIGDFARKKGVAVGLPNLVGYCPLEGPDYMLHFDKGGASVRLKRKG